MAPVGGSARRRSGHLGDLSLLVGDNVLLHFEATDEKVYLRDSL